VQKGRKRTRHDAREKIISHDAMLYGEREMIFLHSHHPYNRFSFLKNEKKKESKGMCKRITLHNVVLLQMIDRDEKVEEPKPSMTFSSLEEVCSYYRKFASQVGFGVQRRTTKKKSS
jgi:hypothetical protein